MLCICLVVYFKTTTQLSKKEVRAQLPHLTRSTLLGALDSGLLPTAVHACCLADAPLCKERKAMGGVFSLS